MDSLTIHPTSRTPFILLDAQKGLIEIRGNSIPENSISFYSRVIDWIKSLENSPKKSVNLVIQLDYFNTSTARSLVEIFNKLSQLHAAGKSEVMVYWEYKSYDEDNLEAGEDFKSVAKVPFEIVKID